MLVGVIKEFFDMARANIEDGVFRHIVECRHESMLGIYEFKCTCISFWNHFGMYELYIYIYTFKMMYDSRRTQRF